ncbi:hypothetical protein AB4K20DRAFT_1920077 [Rhizopus microsporus]
MHTMLEDYHFLSFFSILSNPPLHWRFISVSADSLSVFVKETLSRGYSEQLRVFYRILISRKQRFNRYLIRVSEFKNKVRKRLSTIKRDLLILL